MSPPPTRPRLVPLLLLGACFALAECGQQAFRQRRPEALDDGLVLHAAAVAAFLLALRAARPPRLPTVAGRGVGVTEGQAGGLRALAGRWQGSTLSLGAAVVLTVALLLSLARTAPPHPLVSLAAWAAAAALLVAAAPTAPRGAARRLSIVVRRPSATTLMVGGFTVVGLVARLWDLDGLPRTFSGDEGLFGQESLKVLAGRLPNPFGGAIHEHPALSFYLTAPTVALLGPTALAMRLPWALLGAATVPLTFLLVQRLLGARVALVATALLATYHFHVHYSRLAMNNIADPFFMVLALLLLYRALDGGGPRAWALCGVTLAVAQYFYSGARLILPLVALVVVLHGLREGGTFWRKHGAGLFWLALAGLLVAAPLAQWAIQRPDEFFAPVNRRSIFHTGWLAQAVAAEGRPALEVYLDQLLRTLLAFNATADRYIFYGLPQPLFDPISGALFALGLGWSTLRLADTRTFPFVAWWWLVMVFTSLTINAPESHKIISLAVPAVVLAALALARLVDETRQALLPARTEVATVALAAVCLGLGTFWTWLYVVDYSPRRVYGDANGLLASEIATYARERLGGSGRLVLIGAPRLDSGFPSIPYLAERLERLDVRQPLTEPPPPELRAERGPTLFVALPERARELDLVRQAFPEGAADSVPSPTRSEPLFHAYLLPAAGEGGSR